MALDRRIRWNRDMCDTWNDTMRYDGSVTLSRGDAIRWIEHVTLSRGDAIRCWDGFRRCDAIRYGPTRSHLHSLGPTRDYRSAWTHLGPNGVLDVGNSIDAMLRGAMRHGAMQHFVTSRFGDAMRYDAIVALRRCDAIRYDDVERCDTGRCDTDSDDMRFQAT